jgi:hypothetical protein
MPANMKVEEDALERYRDEIRTLKEENELLRMSARFFGALAERLHVRLQDARRQTELPGQSASRRRRQNCLHAGMERSSKA